MNILVNKLVLTSILFLSHSVIGSDITLKKGWAKPNAWEKGVSTIETDIGSYCECLPKAEKEFINENSIQAFYKKLLMMLFDRNVYSKNNNQIFKRGILFKISESDLNMLEKSVDPRDWDEIVTKVFQNIESTDFEDFKSVQHNSVLDNLNFYMNSSWSSYFKLNFLTLLIFVIVPVLFLHTKYNYNLIAIGLLAIFLVGYVNEYKICNSELGIEKVVSLLDDNFYNPCEGFDIQGSDIKISKRPWYDFWSKPSKKEECVEYLRKQSKKRDDSDWCSPDDVLLRYIYNVYMKQFDMVIRKSTDGLQKIMGEMPFPWNYFGGGLFVFLLTTFLGLFFKYVIATFITRIPSLKEDPQPNNYQSDTQTANNHERYHEMLLLQNDSINKLANALNNQPVINIGSRVQILENSEPIEALSEPINDLNETVDQNLDQNKIDIDENENTQTAIKTPTADISQKS